MTIIEYKQRLVNPEWPIKQLIDMYVTSRPSADQIEAGDDMLMQTDHDDQSAWNIMATVCQIKYIAILTLHCLHV